jgi:hypothetical protein
VENRAWLGWPAEAVDFLRLGFDSWNRPDASPRDFILSGPDTQCSILSAFKFSIYDKNLSLRDV